MKIPKDIKAYCTRCKKHTDHNVKKIEQRHSRPKPRTLSRGQLRHVRKTKGYTSKVAGKLKHVKQATRNVLLLECKVCKRTQQRSMAFRTKRKLEFKK